ncbi:MAG: hypothetical protein ACRDSK_31280 [Actinophytocola sp.]|uniref:hypothetical protein n=1 Tax=Actinophytocola sp. TaxID=1872138 RepID=UPI003D6AF989
MRLVVYVAALAAFLAALVVLLVVLLVRQQERHNQYTARLLAAFREERAQLLNKISAPQRPMPDGRPTPKVAPRRSPANAREHARVGTVRPPRPPGPGEPANDFLPPDAGALDTPGDSE